MDPRQETKVHPLPNGHTRLAALVEIMYYWSPIGNDNKKIIQHMNQ
jgi:hypothetical protein